MRYNTGNPVGTDGSNDPRDLFDNSGIIDLLLTGPLGEYLNRLGVPLKSWIGIMQQVTDYLIDQGYESIYLTYGAGVVVERQTQLVQRDGELYRVMNAADIPLTLTGTWVTDAPKLQAAGDAALRQALANSADPTLGAAMVARAIRHVNSIAELRALAGQYDGEVVYLRGRTASAIGQGAGNFVWMASSSAADDDGVTIGKWVRQFAGAEIDAGWYGFSVSSSQSVNTAAIQAAVNTAIILGISYVRLPGKGIFLAGAITGAASVVFVSNGAFFSDYLYAVEQGIARKEVAMPAAFSWLGGKFYTGGATGLGKTTLTAEGLWRSQETPGVVNYYVDPVNGSDANTGLGSNAPLKTIAAAIAKSDVGVIQVKAGVAYESLGNVIGVSVNRDIQIRSMSGANDVIIRNGVDSASVTWTVATGNTYQASINQTIYRVMDKTVVDARGDYLDLRPQTSITNVNNNPGSYWYDSATGIIYVRMHTNRSPSGDALLFRSSTSLRVSGNRAVLLKNLRFEGGGGINMATASGFRPRLYAVDSSFRYSANNGIEALGSTAYLERCIIAKSGLDNLNYHDDSGLSSRALEIDVVSYGAGDLAAKGYISLTESQNASSMHDSGSVVRINGTYDESYGPVIPDTGASSSMNIGVYSGRSLATDPPRNASYYSEGGMYLIDSTAKASIYDLRPAAGGTLSIRGMIMAGSILREGGGKVQQF
ncbi:hypothetical protein BGP82_19515 [Pseudomonas putida]|uniref:Uncharacterized protein n=1 Tax=Pseudomonas putida TaxID=303 RepID=A0A2S3WQ20_PSEPU|nr:hypothetical protein [Pseudomonas putida]POG03462.1 hypothetical protein BGP82_19515 [Pseudomonas putida]